MCRVLVQLSVWGNDEDIQSLSAQIDGSIGRIVHVGTKSMKPENRCMSFCTPWHEIDNDNVNDGLYSFIEAHKNISALVSESSFNNITLRLTVCPVDETQENSFSCLIGIRTVRKLAELGLEFEISPAVVMPQATYWPIE
jgi:hypothetical protein